MEEPEHRSRGAGPAAGYREEAVVRHFESPDAVRTRFYEVRAKSILNQVPEGRGCRSDGRSTVPRLHPRVQLLLRPPYPRGLRDVDRVAGGARVALLSMNPR